jgi:hypothetical protein
MFSVDDINHISLCPAVINSVKASTLLGQVWGAGVRQLPVFQVMSCKNAG